MKGMALTIAVFALGSGAVAGEFPVKDAHTAIMIGKKVCGDSADSRLRWDSQWNPDHQTWIVSTVPSICPGLTKKLWYVEIPIDGPEPSCRESLYSIACLSQIPKQAH